MKKLTLVFFTTFLFCSLSSSQYIHQIKADSVRIHNDTCNAELILENSTRNINGFLYNKGNGRTEFKKALEKRSDNLYLIGGDSLILTGGGGTPQGAWSLTGNAGTNPDTNFLGTTDNKHLYFKTNNKIAGFFSSFAIADRPKLQVNGPILSQISVEVYGTNPAFGLIGDLDSYYPALLFRTRDIGRWEHSIMSYGGWALMYDTAGDHWFRTSSGATVYIKSTGNMGIGQELPTSKIDIQGLSNATGGAHQLRLRKPYTPTSQNDPAGNIGDISWDENHIYVKTEAGWKRSALGW